MASHARSSASGIFGHLGLQKGQGSIQSHPTGTAQAPSPNHRQRAWGNDTWARGWKNKVAAENSLARRPYTFQKKIQQRKALTTSSSSKSKISAATFVHTSENQTKELIHRFSCNKPRHGNIVRTAPWALHDANNELQDQTCITSLEWRFRISVQTGHPKFSRVKDLTMGTSFFRRQNTRNSVEAVASFSGTLWPA